jgi:putative ATPase
MDTQQPSLFPEASSKPLAFSSRPSKWEDFYGQKGVLSRLEYLKRPELAGVVFHGPPGCGKTTFAYLLAAERKGPFRQLNAVLDGLPKLKQVVAELEAYPEKGQVFIDEIHRFNKAQQDALLPLVESGKIFLMGATTENPYGALQKALLSRIHLERFEPLSGDDIHEILQNSAEKVTPEVLALIESMAAGDARRALNFLETAVQQKDLPLVELRELFLENNRSYDRTGDDHYDVISAFIKSMRGSDPDSALLWMARMIEGGEDPEFIARRMVIFASEDVGNADPSALTLAVSTLTAVQNIGMPEARISLAQCCTYLASTYKSKAAYNGIGEALAFVRESPGLKVPGHLKNHGPEKKNYKYPPNYPGHFVLQDYSGTKIPQFYRPGTQGKEGPLGALLKERWISRRDGPEERV